MAKPRTNSASEKTKQSKNPPLLRAGDFRVLYLPLPMPLKLLPSSFQGIEAIQQLPKNDLVYCIFFRLHSSRRSDSSKPEGRTLFLCGLPSDATESHIRDLFNQYGAIETVQIIPPPQPDEKLHSLREDGLASFGINAATIQELQATGASEKLSYLPSLPSIGSCTGYIVFEDDEDAQKALQMRIDPKRTWLSEEKSDANTRKLYGMSRWYHLFQTTSLDPGSVESLANGYMESYDTAVAEARKQEEDKANKPDDDGFITVTKASANRAKRPVEKLGPSSTKTEEKKKEPGVLTNFYRFQVRQAKRDQLADLRRKFEDDKKRISQLKASRKFRPY